MAADKTRGERADEIDSPTRDKAGAVQRNRGDESTSRDKKPGEPSDQVERDLIEEDRFEATDN